MTCVLSYFVKCAVLFPRISSPSVEISQWAGGSGDVCISYGSVQSGHY